MAHITNQIVDVELIDQSYFDRALRNCLDEGVSEFNKRRKKRKATRYPVLKQNLPAVHNIELSAIAILKEAVSIFESENKGQKVRRNLIGGYASELGVARAMRYKGFSVLDRMTGEILPPLNEKEINIATENDFLTAHESNDMDMKTNEEAYLLFTEDFNTLIDCVSEIDNSSLILTIVQLRKRNAAVRAMALKIARGKCESCGDLAPFERRCGQPYLEVHHVARLADDGKDILSNLSSLCPSCHREIHYGKNGDAKNMFLKIYVSTRVVN